jgi:misacylated tRNA(Ala) deacylase
MTNKVFSEDAYLTTYQSTIVSIEKSDTPSVVLEGTIFYALSGGQPGDVGYLKIDNKIANVIDTRFDKDRKTILHFLEPTADLSAYQPGQSVSMEIDWERRHRLMRMHSAMHLLCALIPFPVTGGGVGETESRVEFDMETSDFDKAELSHQLNNFVAQDLPVDISFISDEELDANPELVRTMSVKPPRGVGQVRMINIGDKVDYQPCGGTHVRSTGEIGELAVTKIKSKGKQNKRVSLALVSP